MNDIGYTALLLALVISAYGTVAPLVAVRLGRRDIMKSAENASYVLGAAVLVGAFTLFYALMTRDFSNQYVYEYTSRELSWFYTASAFWAGNAGSMLLWLFFLGVFTALVVYQNRRKNRELLPYVITVLMGTSLFFAALMVFSSGSNPFVTAPAGGTVPENGFGLNPMLANPGMVIHPVSLYAGLRGRGRPVRVRHGGARDQAFG